MSDLDAVSSFIRRLKTLYGTRTNDSQQHLLEMDGRQSLPVGRSAIDVKREGVN